MPRFEFYDRNLHGVTVDGVRIEDFAEGDDVIAWAPEGNLVQATQGMDSNALAFSSPRTGKLTLKLKATSPSIALLQELADLATYGQARLFDCTITTGVNDFLYLFGCGMEDQEFQTGGESMPTRSYVIVASNYQLAGGVL